VKATESRCAPSLIYLTSSTWFALSSPLCKNIFVPIRPKSPAYSPPSHPNRATVLEVARWPAGLKAGAGAPPPAAA